MKHKFLLLYSWLVRVVLYFLPDIPIIMRFRGWLYSLGMQSAGKNFQVAHNVILNSIEGLSVGNNVYFSMGNILFSFAGVYIGNEVIFGPDCLLTTGNHTFKEDSYRFGLSENKPVRINEGSWIGAHCVILAGAVFPTQSILAAGAVLTGNFQNTTKGLYGGIPAKLIKPKC